MEKEIVRFFARAEGRVQGVGFRFFPARGVFFRLWRCRWRRFCWRYCRRFRRGRRRVCLPAVGRRVFFAHRLPP